MPDSITNRVNVWDKKTKCEIYNGVIQFKDRRKNPYHWDYEDDLHGLLEQTNPHEDDSIHAKFPGVGFDTDKADGTATDQEVKNYNTMASGASDNADIVHVTPHTDGMQGTAPPVLSDNDDENIKEVDIIENEPAETINVATDNTTGGEQEDLTDYNPGDNSPQNQYGVSNKEYDTATIDSEDTTKYPAAGDNPEGSIKVEDVDTEDDSNISDDDVDNVMGVDDR